MLFCFIYKVVTSIAVADFVPGGVVTCDDVVVVRRVSWLFAVEGVVEVVVAAVCENKSTCALTLIIGY